MRIRSTLLTLVAVATVVLAACGPGGETGDTAAGGTAAGGTAGEAGAAAGSVEYVLWDSLQLPPYQQCAALFMEQNPDITIEIVQLGWDDYWNRLTTGFVSGDAPPIFTDHLAKYPEFVSNDLLLPLNDLIERDQVPTDIYHEGLADLWKSPEGQAFGLPKDFDTIAVVYNTALVEEAGITEDEINNMTWNPQDGGTYEEIIAKLTVDANGVRGNEAGFDPSNVEVFGLGLEGAGSFSGQTQWSHYAASNGFQFLDENPWGTQYQYDDDALADTIAWWRGLIDKGYMPSLEQALSSNFTDVFNAGGYGMVTDGSWKIVPYTQAEGVEAQFAPLPEGPQGRASMFNGLADSITASADNPEAAWEWFKFLASPDCQNIIGDAAVVLPAIPEATDKAIAVHEANGVNINAFTVHVDEGTTFLFPITDNGAQVTEIMTATMDSIMLGQADPYEALDAANEQVNALFGQ